MSREKKVVIIVGPNGAGKTTFATEFLRHAGAGIDVLTLHSRSLVARVAHGGTP